MSRVKIKVFVVVIPKFKLPLNNLNTRRRQTYAPGALTFDFQPPPGYEGFSNFILGITLTSLEIDRFAEVIKFIRPIYVLFNISYFTMLE